MAIAIRDPADAELVRGHLGGEVGAMEILYRRYFPRLVRLARRRLGDQAAAEDVAQDTILRALDHLTGFDQGRPMWPWLKAIASNLIADRFASKTELPIGDEELEISTSCLEEEVELRHERPILAEALSRLPGRQRTAVALRYVEDWRPDEAAAFLGVSELAFAQLLHRARARLRSEYRRLSGGALGALLLPLRLLRRIAARLRHRTAGSGSEAIVSGTVSQVTSGMVALVMTIGGVAALPARTEAAPKTHIRVVRTADHPRAHAAGPAHHRAQVAPRRATTPRHHSAGTRTPVQAAGSVVKDMVDPTRRVKQPEDAQITSIAFAPGSRGRTVYAAGVTGCPRPCTPVLFRSRNGGHTWTRLPASGFDSSQLLFPPGRADRRIFAMGRTGLQVSSNGGRSWQPALVLGESTVIGSAAISPGFDSGDPSILIGSQTLMRYRDDVGAAEPVAYPMSAPLEPAYAPAYPSDPRIIVGGVALDPATGKTAATVYTCTDDLCSNTQIAPGNEAPKIRVARDFATSNAIYAFTQESLYALRSGDSASERIKTWPDAAIRDVTVISRDVILAAVKRTQDHGAAGLYLSRDGGQTWTRTAYRPFSAGASSISVSGSRLVVALQSRGIACSSNGGRTWDRRCSA